MLWLLVIATLVVESVSFCELNGDALKCDGESLENVVSQYITAKDGLNSMSIRNCNTRKLEDNSIPFKQIETLQMACSIQELKPQSLQGLDRLKTLNLSGNKISQIPKNFFQHLPRLESLDLSKNFLRNPSVKTFQHLNNLKILNLSSNQITNIDNNIFTSSPKIEELYLSDNNIFVLIEGVFDDIPNLRVLDISRNLIYGIMVRLFEDNFKLEKVVMAGNSLQDFNSSVFRKNAEMRYLDMGFCKLENIDAGGFDSMTKLRTLILSGNPLTLLPTGVFDKLLDLEHLELSNMSLLSIRDDLFAKNLKLLNLDLSVNNLTQLSDAVVNLPQLNTFKFAVNKIIDIPLKMDQLNNLKFINASYNEIVEIKKNNINWANLDVCDLRGNKIDYLDPGLFENSQSSVRHLDVRDNRLVFVETKLFKSFPKLRRFEFTGNPWDCKCMNNLLAILELNRVQFLRNGYFNGERSVCVIGDDSVCSFNRNNNKKYYQMYIAGSS